VALKAPVRSKSRFICSFDRQHRFSSPEIRRFNPVFALTDFGRWVPMCVLNFAADTLGGAVRLAESLAAGNSGNDGPSDWHNQLAGLALMVLLYLSGDPDVVRIVHQGEKPAVKQSIMRRDPERFKDLQEPQLNLVGTAFSRAIERWEIERAHESDWTSGGSVRPHMRRAHTHLYWTGEGRQVPRVRFLLPISVKGAKLVEEPEDPQVTTVR
jgi:hypothetical protein